MALLMLGNFTKEKDLDIVLLLMMTLLLKVLTMFRT